MTAFIWTIAAMFTLSLAADISLLGKKDLPFSIKELDNQRRWRIGIRAAFILWALYLLTCAQ